MLVYCLKCRKNTENRNPKVVGTINGNIMLLSKSTLCDSKKSKFIKEQKAIGLLSSLTTKALLNKVSLFGLLFCLKRIQQVNTRYKLNEIVNTFLLAGEKRMSENHLRQLYLHIVLVDHSLKIKKEQNKNKETGDSRYIYQNELDKACFQYEMAYGEFKDLNRRIFANNVLRNKEFDIAKDSKYDGYQCVLASMLYKLFDKKNFCRRCSK